MATPAASEFVALARTLPLRLTRFFARWPPGTANDVRANPFKPTVHPVTHRWHNPVFSLRRQAELCKLARRHGVEELLPPSRKRSDEVEKRARERAEKGIIKVRGHRDERTLKGRIEMRKEAMRKMPKLIESWKRRGHGKGWKEWPTGKAKF
ncbi:hypothetical protein EDC01DRAFT_778322 [Geopyxis carbonaria]|nr:hypothetical protein EDC01DRAFT_778322 [Geopyxis carbonaria]